MQAAELFWSSIITIRSLAGSLLHGDRSGLARRARRLHKSRGAIDILLIWLIWLVNSLIWKYRFY